MQRTKNIQIALQKYRISKQIGCFTQKIGRLQPQGSFLSLKYRGMGGILC
jgi:hypothetical protein